MPAWGSALAAPSGVLAGSLQFLAADENKNMRGETGYIVGRVFETGAAPLGNITVPFGWKLLDAGVAVPASFEVTTTPSLPLAVYAYSVGAGDGNRQAARRLSALQAEGADVAALRAQGEALAMRALAQAQAAFAQTLDDSWKLSAMEEAFLLRYRLWGDFKAAQTLSLALERTDNAATPTLAAIFYRPPSRGEMRVDFGRTSGGIVMSGSMALSLRTQKEPLEGGFSEWLAEVAPADSMGSDVKWRLSESLPLARAQLLLRAEACAEAPYDVSLAIYLYRQSARQKRSQFCLEDFAKEGFDMDAMAAEGARKAAALLEKYPRSPLVKKREPRTLP